MNPDAPRKSSYLSSLDSEAGNLSEGDRQAVGRQLGSPADFPPEFKGWVKEFVLQEVIPAIAGRQIQGAPSGAAPDNASFVTINSNSRLSGERTLAAGTEIDVTDGGANGPVTIRREPIPFCDLTHATDQSIADVTPTILAFDTEISDTLTMHAPGSNTRITVPAAGVYGVLAKVLWDGPAPSAPLIEILLNGTTVIESTQNDSGYGGSVDTHQPIATYRRLAANDYLEVRVTQDSGGAVNALTAADAPHFQVVWLGA